MNDFSLKCFRCHRDHIIFVMDPIHLQKTDFKQRFRLSRNIFIGLLNMVQDSLCQTTHHNMSLSSILQLLIELRYYTTGAFQSVLGYHIQIHKSRHMYRIIKRLSTGIASLKPNYIQMEKTGTDRNFIHEDFYITFQFLKGYFSINVQAICNSNLLLTNIVARWPGSVHDSTIFDNSLL
ncbi:unnamed protein product [Macrosiphum euphorbiae]|uniref:DDE Tnp4 domain-containing protein n=1 Tax=Macrosiphum euphorbiae TaxID=13131 RepID=A0AAV0WBZ6_9HEMI|nr:unnamed protein product [Macrosiphum euphorbiae]